MKRILALAALLAALALAACVSTGCYTGDEFYYSQAGVDWSCRAPAPYEGGNCRPEASWPDKALAACRLADLRAISPKIGGQP